MIIRKVEAIPVTVPLETPYVISQGVTKAFHSVLIKIFTDTEIVGFGECCSSTSFRDESFEGIKSVIDHGLGPAIIGSDPFDLESIFEKMESRASHNFQAKAGIDFALFDIQGKSLNKPLYKIIGGSYNKILPVTYTLSADNVEETVTKAEKMIEAGYKTLVVKLKGPEKTDILRFKSVRETVGPDIKIRADCNQAYNPVKAIRIIKKIERYDPEFIEQPVKRWDLKGMARVVRSVDAPISADESNVSINETRKIIELEAADILNIKVPKNGGIYLSKKIANIAESADIPCLVGGMMTLEIARQASRHFAVSTKQVNTGYGSEGCGPASQSLLDDITKKVVTYNDVKRLDGNVSITDEPGLGVELDDLKVEKYSSVY